MFVLLFRFLFLRCVIAHAQASPYLTGMPQLSSPYSHYVSASPMLQVVSPDAAVNSQLVAAQGAGGYGAPANKLQRSDRIEVGFFYLTIHPKSASLLL